MPACRPQHRFVPSAGEEKNNKLGNVHTAEHFSPFRFVSAVIVFFSCLGNKLRFDGASLNVQVVNCLFSLSTITISVTNQPNFSSY